MSLLASPFLSFQMQNLEIQWTDFHKVWYWGGLQKNFWYCTFQFWLKLDNNGRVTLRHKKSESTWSVTHFKHLLEWGMFWTNFIGKNETIYDQYNFPVRLMGFQILNQKWILRYVNSSLKDHLTDSHNILY
jgi:hypothetical protein